MDEESQGEAWVRKKPRRIIQNQILIQLLIILSMAAPIPLTGVIFWLIFGIAPVIVVPSILIAWIIISVSFITIQLHIERRNKKEENLEVK